MLGCLCGTLIIDFTLLCSRHESTREGIRACEASRHASIYQFMCPAWSGHIFLMTLVSKEMRREDSCHLVPRYRPLVERFQYINRSMSRTRMSARRQESLQ